MTGGCPNRIGPKLNTYFITILVAAVVPVLLVAGDPAQATRAAVRQGFFLAKKFISMKLLEPLMVPKNDVKQSIHADDSPRTS